MAPEAQSARIIRRPEPQQKKANVDTKTVQHNSRMSQKPEQPRPQTKDLAKRQRTEKSHDQGRNVKSSFSGSRPRPSFDSTQRVSNKQGRPFAGRGSAQSFASNGHGKDAAKEGNNLDAESSLPGSTHNLNVAKSPLLDDVKGPLIIEPANTWHLVPLSALPSLNDEEAIISPELIDRIHEHAQVLLERELRRFRYRERSITSSSRFYSTIMTSGTLSDKIGTLTLSIQESPLHNLEALDTLIALARKRSRAQAVEVLGALKDLFGPGNLLPSDRKLKAFRSQSSLYTLFAKLLRWSAADNLPESLSEADLILWAFEDRLKSAYFEVLKILEIWCNDEITFARAKAVDYVYALLAAKPEQEANLLRLLVNKLGDSDRKIASKASFNILQLETTHPSMKLIVTQAIEANILFHPSQSLHAKYFAIITVNQTILSKNDTSTAQKLLDIYFALFIQLLEQPSLGIKKEVAPTNQGIKKINAKGEIQGGGAVGGKAAQKKLARNEKMSNAKDTHEKMLSAVLTGINRALPFTDRNDDSVEKHVDMLYRVAHSSNLNTSIQALMLIQQLLETHQQLSDRFFRTLYESLLDPRILTSSKQVLYLNLLYRALRSDHNVQRVKAFAKRLLQVAALHQPAFTCGVIYLLKELEVTCPALASYVDQAEATLEDELERFGDHATTDEEAKKIPTETVNDVYDGRKRDPIYSNASSSTLWETSILAVHYHPSVALFATSLRARAVMPPKPDVNLHTLIHFLDRFVYKNPKNSELKGSTTKGRSLMQPLAGGDKSAVLLSAATERNANLAARVPVNSEDFWRRKVDAIQASEIFFHRYFSAVGKSKDNSGASKAKPGQDSNTVGDEEEEDAVEEKEIWDALLNSAPEVDGSDPDMDGSVGSSEFESYADDDSAQSDGDPADEIGQSKANEQSEDDDMLSLEDSDDTALFDSDDDVSMYEDQPVPETSVPITGPDGKERSKNKRKTFKHMPTFADAESYEKMLGGDEEEGVA